MAAQHRSVESHLLRLLVHVRDTQHPDPEGTRGAITAEAMTLFTQLGYGGTSMRAIASAVGIQAASLYAHYPRGKQQILFEGLRDICDGFLDHVSRTLTAAMSSQEQFETLLRRHVEWQLANGPEGLAWHAAFGGLGVRGALAEEQAAEIKATSQLYHDYLEALVRDLCGEADAVSTTQACLTLCNNAHRLRATPEEAPHDVADTMVLFARRIAALEPVRLDA